MSARKQLRSVIAKARRDAWRVVAKETRSALPKGWALHFAVGWGLTLLNAEGKVLAGTYRDGNDLPNAVRKACLLAADFFDMFGPGNEVIRGAE